MIKKLPFLLLLSFASLHAQDFPEPYCQISEDYEGVEPITSVALNGTSITNEDDESVLLDFTSTIVDVQSGTSYDIELTGDSVGEYNNEYVAYIDWDQNGVLDDEGEVYYIGMITDSDGHDGQSAITNIPVPEDAALGNTRIRIIKTYTDEEYLFFLNYDPCFLSAEDAFYEEIVGSYGQVLDFTLNVTALGIASNNKSLFKVYPNPVENMLNLSSASVIDEVAVYDLQGRLILKNSGNINAVNVGGLPAGQYLIKVNSGGLSHTDKFIKK